MFSRISRGLAVVALVLGVIQLVAGLGVGFRWFTWERAFGGVAHPAELLSQGSYMVIFALALGTLGEIGMALNRAFPKE